MDNNYKQFEEVAEFLKVLAHPVRLCIVKGLLEKGCCNVSSMQNCMEMPQSTISQHLQKLRSVGIIKGERNGLEIVYKIADSRVEKILEALII
ncbi:ArsR/SmtB family transcription factor [Clostridium septicum]|uniref:ArsR family transcriptional regulator n=1 Tax=Clostridium septicum TaxID=1504 RepID=A0A9N7JLG2_CLOSE|nr:metalloregulator ArsR/SmtB family transcription factor [Clostridium septicum]AYE34918.1 ArsR family transcriptional regulator [Clostridium septicum]MDU1313863.1 metalloregulator ArsR/SmtB family transcription factor [Clostridium septicum]QAS60312.1 ArsR family transcriptional regulator [Clostridium septicum]UEC20433.1 metalloregulator ArsR/SmtB family transcription factor [Clostridium septicum]USS01510.1 metalloregulator ArsR/SmtB family transcription factor [Clostridium septicum]